MMKSEQRNEQPGAGWFATFMVLDVSGAIPSSPLRRLIAFVKTLFRRR